MNIKQTSNGLLELSSFQSQMIQLYSPASSLLTITTLLIRGSCIMQQLEQKIRFREEVWINLLTEIRL